MSPARPNRQQRQKRQRLLEDRRSTAQIVLPGLICLIGMLSAGCGQSGPRRVPIFGTVERAGSPVRSGIISLLPTKGHHGPAVTAPIQDGRYKLDETTGPVAGPHKLVVVLEAEDKAGFLRDKAVPPPPAHRASRRWEFLVDVPEEGPFEHNVLLQ